MWLAFSPAVGELDGTVSTYQIGTKKKAELGGRVSRDGNKETAQGHKEPG